MGKVHNNWLSSPRAMDDLYPVSNVLIPKISLPIHNTFLRNKWDVTLQHLEKSNVDLSFYNATKIQMLILP